MSEEQTTTTQPGRWWLHWGLDVIQLSDTFVAEIDSPDVNMFRVSFPDKETAYLMRAEIQRYLGDLLQSALTKPTAIMDALRAAATAEES